MWLFDIIKDGTLVDNRSYFVNNGIFTNKSLGESISLKTKTKGQWTKEGANKQVISSQADSLIKISRIWADFFPANTSNQPI